MSKREHEISLSVKLQAETDKAAGDIAEDFHKKFQKFVLLFGRGVRTGAFRLDKIYPKTR
jgi:hypothetical protein